ncbi:MAG: 3-phosphoshikimate 1-carboxyvinyltransferase, partial [Firmicutes bacterium]|nr:3-phosphoshikimate 1-carboxyvinyltransferase [Bacillota bacterium]
QVEVRGTVSSQFTSALLFLAPLLPDGLTIQVMEGLRSPDAVRTTLEVLAQAGIRVEADWERLLFQVPGGQRYRPGRFTVNGDYPGAMAVLAAAALVPGEVTITGLLPDAQGERSALEALVAMGAELIVESDRIKIKGGRPLRGIVFDGDRAIDAVLSLATVAAFAEGDSVFTRVGHLRFKESDRLGDFAAEMRRAGLELFPRGEELIVKGRSGSIPGGATLSAHQDHRLIMAFTAVGLRAERGLVIDGAEHVGKSYPGFFADLRRLGATIIEEAECGEEPPSV